MFCFPSSEDAQNIYLTRSRAEDSFQIERSPPVYDFIILLSKVSLITPLIPTFAQKNFMLKEITLLSNLLKHAHYLKAVFKSLNPISTGGRCFPRKFCLPVDNFFSFQSIATKFGDFS